MKPFVIRTCSTLMLMLGLVLAPAAGAAPAGGEDMYALTASNRLIKLNSSDPCTSLSRVKITGLQPGEDVLGIDFRPLNGKLYGLGSTSRIYTIDLQSGAATMVGTQPFTATLTGSAFGFDFNPSADRIRINSDSGQNIRVHPDTGALAATDTSLAYAVDDPNEGRTPGVAGAAYTNPDNDPNTGTTLYDIDARLDVLVTQDPPNDGTLNTIGRLQVNTSRVVAFDISISGAAYAALRSTESNNFACSNTALATIDLTTGNATLLGTFLTAEPVRGLAVPTP